MQARDVHHSGKGQVVINSKNLLIAACYKSRLVSLELSVVSRLGLKGSLGVESVHFRAVLRDAPHVIALYRGDFLLYCFLPFRALRAAASP